jgi:hypothetical protein
VSWTTAVTEPACNDRREVKEGECVGFPYVDPPPYNAVCLLAVIRPQIRSRKGQAMDRLAP